MIKNIFKPFFKFSLLQMNPYILLFANIVKYYISVPAYSAPGKIFKIDRMQSNEKTFESKLQQQPGIYH